MDEAVRRKRRPRRIGKVTRDRAAILCATRAADEATGRIWLGSHSDGKRKGGTLVWTPYEWTERERMIATKAFQIAIWKIGPRRGDTHTAWAEAEAMIRTGFLDKEGA